MVIYLLVHNLKVTLYHFCLLTTIFACWNKSVLFLLLQAPQRKVSDLILFVASGLAVCFLLSLKFINRQVYGKEFIVLLLPTLFPSQHRDIFHCLVQLQFERIRLNLAISKCFRKVVENALYFGNILLQPLPTLPPGNDCKTLNCHFSPHFIINPQNILVRR